MEDIIRTPPSTCNKNFIIINGDKNNMIHDTSYIKTIPSSYLINSGTNYSKILDRVQDCDYLIVELDNFHILNKGLVKTLTSGDEYYSHKHNKILFSKPKKIICFTSKTPLQISNILIRDSGLLARILFASNKI